MIFEGGKEATRTAGVQPAATPNSCRRRAHAWSLAELRASV
jgi:hypothetical protein